MFREIFETFVFIGASCPRYTFMNRVAVWCLKGQFHGECIILCFIIVLSRTHHSSFTRFVFTHISCWNRIPGHTELSRFPLLLQGFLDWSGSRPIGLREPTLQLPPTALLRLLLGSAAIHYPFERFEVFYSIYFLKNLFPVMQLCPGWLYLGKTTIGLPEWIRLGQSWGHFPAASSNIKHRRVDTI